MACVLLVFALHWMKQVLTTENLLASTNAQILTQRSLLGAALQHVFTAKNFIAVLVQKHKC
jgi:hypothetical protein